MTVCGTYMVIQCIHKLIEWLHVRMHLPALGVGAARFRRFNEIHYRYLRARAYYSRTTSKVLPGAWHAWPVMLTLLWLLATSSWQHCQLCCTTCINRDSGVHWLVATASAIGYSSGTGSDSGTGNQTDGLTRLAVWCACDACQTVWQSHACFCYAQGELFVYW